MDENVQVVIPREPAIPVDRILDADNGVWDARPAACLYCDEAKDFFMYGLNE